MPVTFMFVPVFPDHPYGRKWPNALYERKNSNERTNLYVGGTLDEFVVRLHDFRITALMENAHRTFHVDCAWEERFQIITVTPETDEEWQARVNKATDAMLRSMKSAKVASERDVSKYRPNDPKDRKALYDLLKAEYETKEALK